MNAYQNRVDVHFKLGNYKYAINDLDFILSSREIPYGYYLKCKAYTELGNKKDACYNLQKAKKLGYSDIEDYIIEFCKQ